MNLDLWLDTLAIHDCIRTQLDIRAKCMIYNVNFILNQLNLKSQIVKNNSELDSKNNCKITVHYINKSYIFIIIMPLDL